MGTADSREGKAGSFSSREPLVTLLRNMFSYTGKIIHRLLTAQTGELELTTKNVHLLPKRDGKLPINREFHAWRRSWGV